MKLKTISFLALTFALLACSKESPIVPEENKGELQFSSSPIDLEGIDAQYAADVSYDQYEASKFDIFLPNSATPTGLVVYIHGGGFTGGDKAFVYKDPYPEHIRTLLSQDIAVATINYRLIENGDTEGVLKSLNDSKRALQYIRYKSEELNIDKERVVLFGTSAGASTSLWLATNDDQKEPSNADPVLQESSRVLGIALNATQSSLDIENRWLNNVFADFGTTWEYMVAEFDESTLFNFYGVSSWEEYETPEIEAYRQKVDMLATISADDPEIWVSNTGGTNELPQTTGHWYHHPFHAREIKEFADAAGVPNVCNYGKPLLYSDGQEEYVDFLIRKLNE
ncbi:MAG: alpha/beta hydrolase [Bacteroidota bacterium]